MPPARLRLSTFASLLDPFRLRLISTPVLFLSLRFLGVLLFVFALICWLGLRVLSSFMTSVCAVVSFPFVLRVLASCLPALLLVFLRDL